MISRSRLTLMDDTAGIGVAQGKVAVLDSLRAFHHAATCNRQGTFFDHESQDRETTCIHLQQSC